MNGRSVPGALRGPLGMGRRLAALISLAAIAAFLFAAPPAGAVAPDAGSIIGNQASATYDDGTGIKIATSNIVQTTVAQVASFTLTTTPQSSTAAPGQTVNFPHTLTNTGNGTDTFDLLVADVAGGFNFTSVTLYADATCDGVPDNFTAITSTGALARNGQYCFIAAAVVPGSAAAGSSDQMTVTGRGNATAAFNGGYPPAAPATNTDTVTVTNNANIITTKALSVTSGPSPNPNLTITLTYTNTGAATATNVTLTDLIGSGATAGMTYVGGSGLWSGSGSPLTEAVDIEPSGIAYDFNNITTPNTVRAVIPSVAPGQSGTLSFRININIGLPPGSATTQNTAYLCYNNGAGLVPGGCNGAPGNSQPTNTVAYTVLGSFDVDATDVSTTPAASSSTDDDLTTNDIVRDASAAQGSTVVFDNVIVNDGNGTDTFNITLRSNTFPAGTSFQIFNSTNSAPLTDSNADAIPDTGPVVAGTATHVFVHAVLPPSATGGPYDVIKRATSVGGGAGVFNEVTDRLLAITTSTVDLTNNSATGPGVGPGPEAAAQVTNSTNPGTTTTFTLFVNNQSTSSDNYDLAASTDSSFASITLPAGWSVSFRAAAGGVGSECSSTGGVIINTGSIAVGTSRAVCALVSVPAAETAGIRDLYFRARSPNTGGTDRKHDAVTVTVNQLTLVPNNVNPVFPGGNVVYQHTLTNTGNVTETAIAFPVVSNTDTLSGSGWNHVLYLDDGDGVFEPGAGDTVLTPGTSTIALTAGASVFIWDNVFAPLGAVVGTTNVTTITVQSGSSAANGSATDSTTVSSSDLTLLKEQVRVDCTSGALLGSFVTTPLSGANAVPPGGCLKYRITGTNSGTTGLTTLSISDSTPGFTTLETAAGGCLVTAATSDPASPAPATGGTAADEATGTVTATKPSLSPLTNVVLTYCVQIDQ